MAHFLGTVMASETLHAHTLAPALTGAGHLLFAGREGVPPEAGALREMVTTVIASAVQER